MYQCGGKVGLVVLIRILIVVRLRCQNDLHVTKTGLNLIQSFPGNFCRPEGAYFYNEHTLYWVGFPIGFDLGVKTPNSQLFVTHDSNLCKFVNRHQ